MGLREDRISPRSLGAHVLTDSGAGAWLVEPRAVEQAAGLGGCPGGWVSKHGSEQRGLEPEESRRRESGQQRRLGDVRFPGDAEAEALKERKLCPHRDIEQRQRQRGSRGEHGLPESGLRTPQPGHREGTACTCGRSVSQGLPPPAPQRGHGSQTHC